METKPEIRDCVDAQDLTDVEGVIDYHNVSFSYNADEPVLENEKHPY